RGTEADRTLATGQHDQFLGHAQIGENGIALVAAVQVERDEQAATPNVADQPRVITKLLQTRYKLYALGPGQLDQALGLDDLQGALRAHHVDQPAAPGGVDPTGDREDVVGHFIDSAA